ncbi:MAG: hypothetical protein ABIQ61_01605 [Ornithinibacter sp.]
MSGTAKGLSAAVLLVALSACGSTQGGPASTPSTANSGSSSGSGSADAVEMFPDVVDATLTRQGNGTFTLDVTKSSPYDSPDRYADGWRVLAPDGTELGTHLLTHDHASEQPFTRTESDLKIPEGVATVTVEGRDQVSGYGGKTRQLDVPRG